MSDTNDLLPLDSPHWADLVHAYGEASDIPDLLRRLDALPDAQGESQPWFDLWSALAHQGDVYPATFAALPHIVAALARDPGAAPSVFFHFPAWVEICRKRGSVAVAPELAGAYFGALARLPMLAATAAQQPWDADRLRSILSAIAAAKGDADVAEMTMELTPDNAADCLQWLMERS